MWRQTSDYDEYYVGPGMTDAQKEASMRREAARREELERIQKANKDYERKEKERLAALPAPPKQEFQPEYQQPFPWGEFDNALKKDMIKHGDVGTVLVWISANAPNVNPLRSGKTPLDYALEKEDKEVGERFVEELTEAGGVTAEELQKGARRRKTRRAKKRHVTRKRRGVRKTKSRARK